MSGPGFKSMGLVLLGALVGALVLGAVVLLARGNGNAPIQIVLPTPGAPASSGPDAGPGLRESSELRVYVSGAVRNPGVYRLYPGDRLEDVLAAAGGPSDEADITRVNLARRVRDEEHYHVPKVGEVPRPVATAPDLAPSVSDPTTGSVTGGGLIDLNTAPVAELMTLPGIGQVKAQAIVSHRERNGDFDTVRNITDVTGIGEVTLKNIQHLVTVAQSP
ncbi:MAG: helix-hairpin-helix domain-containing protein [Dehalococcoidia bacterium]